MRLYEDLASSRLIMAHLSSPGWDHQSMGFGWTLVDLRQSLHNQKPLKRHNSKNQKIPTDGSGLGVTIEKSGVVWGPESPPPYHPTDPKMRDCAMTDANPPESSRSQIIKSSRLSSATRQFEWKVQSGSRASKK